MTFLLSFRPKRSGAEKSPITPCFLDRLPFIRRSAFAEKPHPTFYNSRYARLRILSNAPLGMTIYTVIPRYPRNHRLLFPSFDGLYPYRLPRNRRIAFPAALRWDPSVAAAPTHNRFNNSRYTRLRVLSNAPLGMTFFIVISYRRMRKHS